LVPATTHARIHTDGVGTQNGDYIVGELARVTDTPSLVNDTCNEIAKLGANRKSWLVFCVTVICGCAILSQLIGWCGLSLPC
jgi:DNA repair protein RadD